MSSKTYIRNGFATNSSSTHHVVQLNDPTSFKSTFRNKQNGTAFQWDDFILINRVSKAQYVAAQLIPSECYNDDYTLNVSEMKKFQDEFCKITNLNKEDVFGDTFDDLYMTVDHQSHWYAKMEYLPFYLHTIINNDNVVILGDNDNNDTSPPSVMFALADGVEVPTPSVDSKIYEHPSYYMLFSPSDGKKFRVTSLEKSPYPELIDVQITTFCSQGCPYCYKDCTDKGQFCSFDDFVILIDKISGKTPEIVLGGGEPTSHPDFAKMLYYCQEKEVSVSFSTGNLNWVFNGTIAPAVIQCASAIGYTIDSTYDMRNARGIINLLKNYHRELRLQQPYWRYYSPVIHWHYIINNPFGYSAFSSEPILENILKEVEYDEKLVLLAYKKEGRAWKDPINEFNDEAGWAFLVSDAMREKKSLKVAIDNELASMLQADSWASNRFSPATYENSDGRFSCYYDLVNKKLHISSHRLEPSIPTSPYDINDSWNKLPIPQEIKDIYE